MVETTAGVEQPHRWTRFQGGYVCADCHARYIGSQDACPAARAGQPRPTEIRDPILRLFIEQIMRQTPNGEAIRVTYHPNGEWSVLPEAAGKADAGLAGELQDYAGEFGTEQTGTIPPELRDRILAALTTGADGGSRQPATHPDSALEQWKLVRGICNNSPMFSDARGWKRVTVELLSALRQPAPRADDALRVENKALRAVLENLMPFVRAEYIECHGFKCRHPTCGSCHGDSETDAAEARGIAAEQAALAALASVEPTATKGD